MSEKPVPPDGYHAKKCKYCGGKGTRVIGYKNPENKVCYYCAGVGWKIAKNPSRSDGGVTRPVYSGGNYGLFRYKLKIYLLSVRGNRCEGCGAVYKNQSIAKEYLRVHHITPASIGGSDDDNNLLLLCFDCHQGKHQFDISKYGDAP